MVPTILAKITAGRRTATRVIVVICAAATTTSALPTSSAAATPLAAPTSGQADSGQADSGQADSGQAERILVAEDADTGEVRALLLDDPSLLELRLRPHSVRGQGFTLYVDEGTGPMRVAVASRDDAVVRHAGDRGHREHGSAARGATTLRGSLRDPATGQEMIVAATMTRAPIGTAQLQAIAIGGDRALDISPDPRDAASAVVPTAPPLHVVTRTALPRAQALAASSTLATTGGSPLAATSANRVLELAFDCDHEFYVQSGGTVSATLARVETLVNALDLIYTQNVAVRVEVTAVVIRTTSSQPYTSSSTGGLLSQFRVHWTSVLAAIPRDAAQLLTGKPLTGEHGAALSNSVCSDNAVSVAEPGFSATFSHGVAVMAHELAHNFGASHCNGDADCQILCSSVNGCNGVTGFGASAVATITQNSQGFACLSDEPAVHALPFQDDFLQLTFDPTRWMNVLGATIDSTAIGEPSPPYALRLDASGSEVFSDDDLRSAAIDLSSATSANLRLSTQHRGAESGEALVVEYSTGAMTWVELLRVTSDGSSQSSFTAHDIALPPGAMTASTRLRLRVEADEPDDAFYVDDLSLLEIDLTAPVLSGLSGTPSPLAPNEVLGVSASATDSGSGVQSVTARLLKGAAEVAQVPLSAAGGATWSGSFPANLALSESAHTLRVTATDAQGNTAFVDGPIDVKDLPVIADASLSPAPALDDQPITASCLVTDFTGVAAVTAERLLNGAGLVQLPLSFDGASGRWKGTFSATGATGTFTVTFRATDTLGNTAVPAQVQTSVSSATGLPPQIGTPSATPDPIKIGQPVSITVSVTDPDSPIQLVTARLEQGTIKGQVTLANSGGSTYSGTIVDSSALLPGTVAVVVSATDLQGNVSGTSKDIQAFDAPQILEIALTPSPRDADDPLTVEVEIVDPSGIATASATLSLDGGTAQPMTLTLDASSGLYVADYPAAGHAGSLLINVSATNTGGVSSDPYSQSFSVDPTPIVLHSIETDAGSVGGGTDVTLFGSGFLVDVLPGSLTVMIGGAPATAVTVVDEFTITARTPPGTEGEASVLVSATKAGAPFSDVLVDGFLYGIPPSLSQVHPGGGSAFAAAKLILLGQGLVGTGAPGSITVAVGDRETTDVTASSDQVLIAALPPGGTPGALDDVTITTPFGTAVLVKSYLVAGVSLREGRAIGSTATIADVAQLDDVNGDGHPDFVVGLPQSTSTGQVRILSGADLSTIATYSGPQYADTFGEHVIAVSDRDGDGHMDFAVADPRADVSASNTGAVHLMSAASGQILWSVSGAAGARLGESIASLGDLNGDTFEEIVAGGPFSGSGAVFVLDGAGGSTLQSLTGTATGEEFGRRLAARVTADGARVAIASPGADPAGKTNAGSMTYATLAAGTLAFEDVHRFDFTEAGAAQGSLGTLQQVALLGESANGERVAIGLPGADLPGSGLGGSDAGQVLVIDTATGAVLFEQRGLLSGDLFGASLDASHDFDDDDLPDLLVGAPGEDSPSATDAGSIRVLSGIDGDRLFERFGVSSSEHYGRRCRALEDARATMTPTVAVLGDSLAARALSLEPQHPETFSATAYPGEKLSGRFDQPRDRDGLHFHVIEGEHLSFVMKPGKKNKGVVHVTLQDETGVIASSDPASPVVDPALGAKAGKTLTFDYEAPSTGVLWVVFGGYDTESTQTFSLTTKRTSSSKIKIKQTLEFATSAVAQSISFEATPGTKGAGKLKGPKNVSLTVDITDPEGNSLATSAPGGFKSSKKDDQVTLVAKKLMLTEAGTYLLTALPAEAGAVKVSVTLTLPSGKGTNKQ